jgi:hypothetical protein
LDVLRFCANYHLCQLSLKIAQQQVLPKKDTRCLPTTLFFNFFHHQGDTHFVFLI